MELQYKRPTAKHITNQCIFKKCRDNISVIDEIQSYIKHGNIDKIVGLNKSNKLSNILEYYYFADAHQMQQLKEKIKDIINEKMDDHVCDKYKSIEKKSGNLYLYDSKIYNIDYDCNCERILDIFKDLLKHMDIKIKSLKNTNYTNGVNSFTVYTYYIEYLYSLITEYLMYRKDRGKIIDTIYTIYKYVSTNIELYEKNIQKYNEEIDIDNIDYLLNIVDVSHKSKIIEIIKMDNWDEINKWENIKKLESVCKKHNLEETFSNKIKAFVNYSYCANHKNSKL